MALQQAITGVIVESDCILRPRLDDVYDLSGEACTLVSSETRPRIDPSNIARPDWNNDLASLHLDIDQEISKAGGCKIKSRPHPPPETRPCRRTPRQHPPPPADFRCFAKVQGI